jgi:hypothetical protein
VSKPVGWISTSAETIRADLDLAASLAINTVRIFLPWNEAIEAARLIDRSGQVASEYLERFDASKTPTGRSIASG